MTTEVKAYPGESPFAFLRGKSGPSNQHGDTGTAARFFPTFRYEAKPSTAEREQGVEHKVKQSAGELTGGRKEGSAGLSNPRAGAGHTSNGRANTHPTVKSIALMQWLCRLITPTGGKVLDPFCGSGTTGIAALREGFGFVGVELDPEYAEIARARVVGDAPLFNIQ
jgi:site-specific DNA-methyltransferase (adenine-specific)